MKVVVIESFEVAGFSIRTKNADEYNISTAKIGCLWGQFGAELAPLLTEKSKVYGIYTNYESDDTGMYDVMAGADTLVTSNLSDIKTVKVQAGKYLVFSAQGEIPNVCLELWKEICEYFSSGNCEYERTYTVDFESYTNCTSGIDIYIAIK